MALIPLGESPADNRIFHFEEKTPPSVDDEDHDNEEEDSDDDSECNPVLLNKATKDWGMNEAPYKIVLVVNQELELGKGKIAAQCGHTGVGC